MEERGVSPSRASSPGRGRRCREGRFNPPLRRGRQRPPEEQGPSRRGREPDKRHLGGESDLLRGTGSHGVRGHETIITSVDPTRPGSGFAYLLTPLPTGASAAAIRLAPWQEQRKKAKKRPQGRRQAPRGRDHILKEDMWTPSG